MKENHQTAENPGSPPPRKAGKKLYIIKIGGNIVDDEKKLFSFLKSFSAIKSKKILVHGGGKVATKIGEQLGIKSKYAEGRRVTDAATIDLVTMVYGGLINKKIVAQLQFLCCNAIGITGADANLIPADKRLVTGIDYGFVGDVKSEMLDAETWDIFLNNKLTPVIAPLTHDNKGQMLNTNADTIAQEIAKTLSKEYETTLIYSFEKEGVLLDVNEESSVIKKMNRDYYELLKTPSPDTGQVVISDGMIPKLDNAFAALENGVAKVIIGKAEKLNDLISGTSGTSIVNE